MRHEYQRYVAALSPALLIVSCSALVCLAVIRFAAVSQWTSVMAARARMTALRENISGKNGPATIKARLSMVHDSLETACAQIGRDFGEAKDLAAIVRLLITKANTADIKFVKMHPQNENASESAAVYPMVLETVAPYHSLGRFISSIESMPHLVRVDRIAVTAVRGGSVEARILVTCFLHSNG